MQGCLWLCQGTAFQEISKIQVLIKNILNCLPQIAYAGYELVSVMLLIFYFEVSKSDRFLAKTEHTPRKLMYFVNRPNAESTKIGHNFRLSNV